MDFWDFLSALWRRWYIAIPLALLVVLGVRWFVNDIEGEHRRDAIVRLEYDQGEVAEYLEVPVNLRSLIQGVQLAVSDDATANKLEREGHTAWYRVRVLDFGRRPILEVTTEHPREVVAESTMNALHREITDQLYRLQADLAGAPDDDLVIAMPIESVQIGEPDLEMSSRSQLALVLAAAMIYGLLLGTIDRGMSAARRKYVQFRANRDFRRTRRAMAAGRASA